MDFANSMSTGNEVAWRNFYSRFMRLLNDYKNMGGRVTASSDAVMQVKFIAAQ